MPVAAQDLPPQEGYDPPAHIALVEGAAILERDGTPDDSPVNMPLLAGDRIRTRAGRVEILFADGSTLHLDHYTTIDLQSDELVRLTEGRIRLSIPGRQRSVAYRIDGPHGWVTIDDPGDYRIAILNGPRGSELELAVLRGGAELANEGGATPLRAGERAFVRAGAAPSYAYVVNSAAWDAFDRWSESRRDERLRASAEYLPDEVRPYAATLSQHGYWRQEPTYGMVWYPRVAVDWRPYYRGRWVSLRPYGWTWVAYDPWGWPTHHFGRWGFASGAWFWIPGRTWGAAWVAWGHAPGYVSWCPLGWNNRPVFQLNVNIGRGYDPWRAWTVIPRRHFGVGYVHRAVVRVDHLDQGIRRSFVHRDRGPEVVGVAVPRGSTPIRVAGTRDNRGGGTPLYTNVPGARSRVTTDGQRVRMQGTPETSGRAGATAVPRERAVPDRPAVRSQRSPDARVAPSDASRPAPRAAGASDARGEREGPNRTPNRAEVNREPAARTAVPRTREANVPRASQPNTRSGTAGTRVGPTGGPTSRSSEGAAPVERRAVPRAEPVRPADSARPSGGTRRMQNEPTGQRAVPRAEPSRRSGEAVRPPSGGISRTPDTARRPSAAEARPAPQVERRGSDRPPSGSYERRSRSEAPPAQAERPARGAASSPAAGARQRPASEPSRGSTARRPRG